MKGRLLVLVGLMTVIAGAVAAWQLRSDDVPMSDHAMASPNGPLASVTAPSQRSALKEPSAYAAVTERPLFIEGRRLVPPPPPAPAARPAAAPTPPPSPPPRLDHLSFVGSITSDDDKWVLLRSSKGGVTRARIGQEIDGWAVREIFTNGVVLEHARSGHRQTLDRGSVAAAATRAAPARNAPQQKR